MYYSGVNTNWGRKVDKFINLLFPMSTYCVVCGNYIDETRKYALCDNCISKMRIGLYYIDLEKECLELNREKILDLNLSCMRYGTIEKELGLSLKFKKNTYLARVISEIMYDRIMNDEENSTDILSSDLIIPIPITESTRSDRGFNQTEKIGKYLSKKINVKMDENVLVRVKDTIPQKKLTGAERALNLSGAFKVNDCDLMGKDIVLLDDFYTTGATIYEATRALKNSGAAHVYALTIACKSNYLKNAIDN